jgi:polynucleotide 5'-kinase involved in rRNA processing
VATHLVVNTSGLVWGVAAHRLKQAKMELLRPHLVLALEREGELSSVLRTLDQGANTLRLPVSTQALRRGQEERRLYRESRFRRYFEKGRPLDFSLAEIVWQGAPLGWGEPLPPEELSRWSARLGQTVRYGVAGDSRVALLVDNPASCPPLADFQDRVHLISRSSLEHRLLGLWGGSRRTLALGVLLPSSWTEGRVQVFTPLPASMIPEVKRLSLGRLRLSLSGRELSG